MMENRFISAMDGAWTPLGFNKLISGLVMQYRQGMSKKAKARLCGNALGPEVNRRQKHATCDLGFLNVL